MSYEYILFDLDGTLCDPGNSIIDSAKFALADMGIYEHDEEKLRRFVGPPLAVGFRTLYGLPEGQIDRAVGLFRQHMRAEGLKECRSYSGIAELLGDLKSRGKRLAVATSKIDEFARQVLEQTDLMQYFEVVAATDPGQVSHKEQTIGEALELLGSPDLKRAVMVGDREHDVIGAQKNGIDAVGVLYGFGNREELEQAKATKITASVTDLATYLSS